MPKENEKTSYQLSKMTFIDRFKERLDNEKNLYQRLGYREYVNFRSRWIKEFFAQQDKIFPILWLVGVFVFGGMVWMIVTFVLTYTHLNARALELMSLDFYQATELKTNSYTASEVPRLNNLYDVINLIDERQDLKQRYQEYFESLSEPYHLFLKYIYLPSLNIWKDPFTQEINTNLIGRDFLDNNMYQDIKLIEKWSNYFRDVGANNQFNDITNIQLGGIQERDDGYFTIPLTLAFSAPNKRAFLLLVDKISVTSNRQNISLINEFTYHLWQIIKTEKVPYRDLVLTGQQRERNDVDMLIGKKLYDRVFASGSLEIVDTADQLYSGMQFDQEFLSGNILLTDAIIQKAIINTMNCPESDLMRCYFAFRDKYRSLPGLAYTVGYATQDLPNVLRQFYRSLPPIINLSQFTFNKNDQTRVTTNSVGRYVGQVTIEIFGSSIPSSDVDEIAQQLGKLCLSEEKSMSIDEGLALIEQNITQLGMINSLNTKKATDLLELKDIFTRMQGEFGGLTNYNKIIKLFEARRMLGDANLCSL